MQTTATTTFDTLIEAIKTAVSERTFYSVCQRATSLGLLGERADLKFSLCYRFEQTDSTGTKLTLSAYSYDRSGPLQRRGGLTRFILTLIENGRIAREYEDQFEGLVEPMAVATL